MAHTPGPWWLSDGGNVWGYVAGKKMLVAKPVGDSDEAEANANLLVAAPDLLEACREFVRKVDAGEARSTRSYAQMKAAIAKASGE